MKKNQMEEIVSLCKRRGFIFPGSEIYGGLANTWDFGPLGAQLKKNIKDHWWKTMVNSRADMLGLDGGIILNRKVWIASGHEDTFNDPLVEDVKTNKRYRADHLLEDARIDVTGMSISEMAKKLEEKGIKSPDGNALSAPKQFNLMLKSYLGPLSEDGNLVYLRPETAQAIFVNFKNVADTNRKRLPFGIAQIGKAFRNEITPGNYIFRTIEFEQMEIEYFVKEENWQEVFETWACDMEAWAEKIGLNKEMIHRKEIEKEELAHYSKRTIDFEFDFPFGRKELWGLAYRTDFDLKNHQESSGEKLEYTDPQDNKIKFIPHVVEPTFGVERTLLALICSVYDEEELEGEKRVVLRFKPQIAPVQIAVLPLMKKEQLTEKAQEIYSQLLENYRSEYDETGSIGKRYRRQDEIGTPFAITIDFDTLEDNSVTVRDRDTLTQERIEITNLQNYLAQRI
jgi:glycyl-tRNA synthetase